MRDRARCGFVLAIAIVLVAAPRPARAAPQRPWRFIADTVLGVRTNQGGIVDYGFRLMMAAGVATRQVDACLMLDRQIGSTHRIPDGHGHSARWTEWTATARLGHRFRVASGLWILVSGGAAVVHVAAEGDIPQTPRTREVVRWNLGLDGSFAVVRRSGNISASLVVGATVVPFSQQLPIVDAYFDMPARIEPWSGLAGGFVF